MADCLFCKIVAHEIDSDIVYESERVVAFRDINPAAPTHLLLIPSEHVASAAELEEGHGEMLAEVFGAAASLARQHDLHGGYRLVTNVGRDAGQSVHHLHFHLIGGRDLSWPPG